MSELSKGELALIIPAANTVTRSPSWQVDGTALVSYPAPASLGYSVPEGSYTLTLVGGNSGPLPTSPGYAFQLQITAGGASVGTTIAKGSQISTPVKIKVGSDNKLSILWANDEFVSGQYDANLKVMEIRLDPDEYDPTFEIIKKLTAATWTPLTDQEAQWFLGG